MDYKKIEILLDKYLEGESTISEEKELKDFFEKNENVPEHLAYAKDLFHYFEDENSLKYTKEFAYPKSAKKINFYYLSGIAASFLLLMFFMFSNYKTEEKIIYAYVDGRPITDINIAEKQMKEVLFTASEKLSVGSKSMNRMSELMNPNLLIKKHKK